MSDREPALLVVLIETVSLSWYVGGISSGNQPFPLLKSAEGDLDGYSDLAPDGQVSFLRHRLAGVLQRGCDRLYSRQMKAFHFLLLADGLFPDAADNVSQQLADHFVQWMMNPSVTYLLAPPGFRPQRDGALQVDNDLQVIAGEVPEQVAIAMRDGLAGLISCRKNPERWEPFVRTQKTDV